MKISKIDEKQLSLRERIAKRLQESVDEVDGTETPDVPAEVPAEETPAEAPVDEVPAEEPAEEDAGEEVTITLTPDEVDILRNIIGMIDGAGEPAPEGDEGCPGCDDPECPDCGGEGDEVPVDDDEPFELPDLSGLEASPDEADSAYFH